MAAGEFGPSALLQMRMKAEAMWRDSAYEASLTPHAEAAVAVLNNQTARFTALQDRNKDNVIGVTWINSCAVDAEDCEANCEIDEPELETGIIEYEPDICKKSGFSIDAEKLRTNDYGIDELTGRGFARSIRALDEFWAQTTMAKLKAFAGVNAYPAPFTYDAAERTTEVPAVNYNVKLVGNLLQQAMLNEMGNPYFIDNGTLYLEWWNSQADAGNLDGRGNQNRINQLRMYFDQFNFAKAGLDEDTFMISPGAIAFQTQNRNPDAPTVLGGKIGHTIFTVPSISLPGVRYDVYYELACKVVGTATHYMHTWRFETRGGIWLNPNGCPIEILVDDVPTTVTPTGILSYTEVA